MATVNSKSQRLSSEGSGRASERVFVNTDVLTEFTLDEETLALKRIDGSYIMSDTVKQYNNYTKDLLESFNVLGVDSNRIKDFKSNAIKSMLIAKEDNK